MKKKFSIMLLVIMCLSLLSGCAQPAQTAPTTEPSSTPAPAPAPVAAKTVWKVAAMGSETHPSTLGLKKFKEEIEKRIGNEVEVQIFPNGQLGTSPDQQIGGLQNGIIQFCDISTGNVTEFSKAFVPLDVPYMVISRDTALKLVDGEIGKMMIDRYEKEAGIKLLSFFDYGFRDLTNSKRAVNKISDMKGLKIRTLSNPIHISAFKAFGANPTAMAYSEVFTGLQQGTIDGQENPLSSIWDAKFYEVQKYISLTNHLYGFLGFQMSADYYNGLKPEWKKAIDEATAVTQEYQRGVCFEQNSAALQKIRDTGKAEINEVTAEEKLKFREASKSTWEMAKEQCGADYFNKVVEAVAALEK